MKKFLVILFGLTIILLVPNLAKALPWDVGNSVTISLSDYVNSDPANKWDDIGGYGGLFTVTNISSGASINTFCLELDEYITQGTIYKVGDISDDVVWKGGRNTKLGDQISNSTKWLYYQYLTGNSNYQDVKALQLAIWKLEDEYYDKTNFDWSYWGSVGTTASSYYINAQGKSITADIRALDLVDESGNPVQSYLIMVPEPATVLLLGVGLVGMAVLMRRRKRTA